ncbi:hypothetical protein LMANV2_120050 [Leptospira interrogans serovar Manilae]|uniref:Uncharacterized protein n=1 Tax=Leptospira interrogans serovar Manilae TaxID=214675 RepID=A0AAQ1SM83_LEPIR|nr:hypothetical protein LMANV2_120050 [Leptospira interrogans serovar Manilae]
MQPVSSDPEIVQGLQRVPTGQFCFTAVVQEELLHSAGLQLEPTGQRKGREEEHIFTGVDGFEKIPLFKSALIVNV